MPRRALREGELAVSTYIEAMIRSTLQQGTLTILGTIPGTQHPEWSYTYVLAETPRPGRAVLRGADETWESDQTMWIDLAAVGTMRLHPGLRLAWPDLDRNRVQFGGGSSTRTSTLAP